MESIRQLQRDKKRVQKQNNLRELANICNALGKALQNSGEHNEAFEQHEEESHICEALGDKIGMAIANRRMGEVLNEMNRREEAMKHQLKHLELSRLVQDLVEEQRALATVGRTYLLWADDSAFLGNESQRKSKLENAKKAFLKSLGVCEKLSARGLVKSQELAQMRSRLHLNLGIVVDNSGNSEQAKVFIRNALQLCEAHNLSEDAMRCHATLAGICYRLDELKFAQREGEKTLLLANKVNDKREICDANVFLGQVALSEEDFERAKKFYYKAYKVKHPDIEERHLIEKKLKTVVCLCMSQESLTTLGQVENNDILKEYEKTADALAVMERYTQALDYYHKTLALTKTLHKSQEELAKIYYSIAETYNDNKQFKEAIEYYEKEYSARVLENPKEACKTLLKIAVVKENSGEKTESISPIYENAFDLAKNISYPKLQLHILNLENSLEGLPMEIKQRINDRKKSVYEEHNIGSDDELTEDEEQPDDEDEIDLACIDFSDSEDESENLDRPRQARQKRSTFTQKRNEKGETALHKACIAGNLNMVKKLIDQKNAVNPRDYAGWIPLHEAANHGFYEIVEFLIDSGAWINDRGGSNCGGYTPIHDAASAGNFNVVRLLMDRGASLTVKTDDGQTPLEVLTQFRNRTTDCDMYECRNLEADMQARMQRAGNSVPVISPTSQRRKSKENEIQLNISKSVSTPIEKRINKKRVSRDWSDDDDLPELGHRSQRVLDKLPSRAIMEDCFGDSSDNDNLSEVIPSSPITFKSHQPKEDNNSATSSYQNAISNVGSAANRADVNLSVGNNFFIKERRSALVTDSEFVGDNWLDDDIGIMSKKKRRIDTPIIDFTNLSESSQRISSFENSFKERPSLSRPKKSKQMKLTTIITRYPTHDVEGVDNFNEVTNSDFGSEITGGNMNSKKLPIENSMAENIGITSPAISTGALRLKIRVQNRLLLVPVARGSADRDVSWLAGEVSRRYYQLAGLRPNLTLTTSDGAVLDPNDPISLVLSCEQGELQGQVTSWDLPPLPERYTQACQAQGSPPLSQLMKALDLTEASSRLCITQPGRLAFTQLQPVLRAIQCQSSLRHLALANCRLADEGISLLVEALPSLPSLDTLDLKCSGISAAGLSSIIQAIVSEDKSPQSITTLDLSNNNLSGATVNDIGKLVIQSNLSSLCIKHCYLEITTSFKSTSTNCSLHTLALDNNVIYADPLASLINGLTCLTTLSICGLKYGQNKSLESNGRLGVALSGILGAGDECLLQNLDLSNCNLSDADMEDISTYLYRCPELTTLNLAQNPDITAPALSFLLSEIKNSKSLPVTTLKLHGNPHLSSVASLLQDLCSIVKYKSISTNPFTCITVAHSETTVLEEAWKEVHKNKASIKKIGSQLFMTCKAG
ncbi:unnamed protein product, partial [Meganyctiphanes norvegica]